MTLGTCYFKQILSAFFILSCTTIATTSTGYAATKKDPLAIWPKAEKGYKKIVIKVPALQDEDARRVELVPQKLMKVDCNHTMISGAMQVKPLTGWGYEYYVLASMGPAISTRMACPDGTLHTKPVNVITQLSLLRYNSKLPIVVYVPTDIELSYRIWSAADLQKTK